MRFFNFLLIAIALSTTACFKSGAEPVTREDDKVRSELDSELSQLESDGAILENQIAGARERIKNLSVSPKMVDIAKNDLYQKESFFAQVGQQIAYTKLLINKREKYFLENQLKLTKEKLAEEHAQYLTSKEANPGSYPWRVKSKKKNPPKKAPESHGGGH